jgi:hypothetical protein
MARLYEALALANESSGTKNNFETFRNQFYQTYPQLVPYSSVKMKFKIETKTGEVESSKQILSDLNTFNIDLDTSGDNLPVLRINFSKTADNKDIVEYSVESPWATVIVKPSSIVYTDTKDVAKRLAYSIFNLKL